MPRLQPLLCGMDFFGRSTTFMENEMKLEIQKILRAVNVSSAAEVNENVMMKLNKRPLARYVESLVNLVDKNMINLLFVNQQEGKKTD